MTFLTFDIPSWKSAVHKLAFYFTNLVPTRNTNPNVHHQVTEKKWSYGLMFRIAVNTLSRYLDIYPAHSCSCLWHLLVSHLPDESPIIVRAWKIFIIWILSLPKVLQLRSMLLFVSSRSNCINNKKSTKIVTIQDTFTLCLYSWFWWVMVVL